MKILSFVAVLLVSGIACADMITTKITKLGCHVDQSMCFLYVSATLPKNTGCTFSDSIRWDGENKANSAKLYSGLMAAMMADKTVTIQVSNNQAECYGAFPTLRWFHLNK